MGPATADHAHRADPAGVGAPMPDIPNRAWHEYGNRVGFWRMLEMLDEPASARCSRSTARRLRLSQPRQLPLFELIGELIKFLFPESKLLFDLRTGVD